MTTTFELSAGDDERRAVELTQETVDLMSRAVAESDYLDEDSSMNDMLAHLSRVALIGGESEELSDSKSEEIADEQARLRENILENL